MDAKLLACVHIECYLRIFVDLLSHPARCFGVCATLTVDRSKLALFHLGLLGNREPFDVEFTLDQLSLGLHRHVFTGSHRSGPCEQTSHPCDEHTLACRSRRSDAEDERNVGHKAIADTEDSGANRASCDVSMTMNHVAVARSMRVNAFMFGPDLTGPGVVIGDISGHNHHGTGGPPRLVSTGPRHRGRERLQLSSSEPMSIRAS
jgi:hypothetical protein